MTYGPHPWATGGFGPGPDEAQRAAGTVGEPHVSEQLWAAEQTAATRREMEELAQRLDAEAAYRRSLDTRAWLTQAQAPAAPPSSPSPPSSAEPWPPRIPRPPLICGPDGNPNSPEAISRQLAAARRVADAGPTPPYTRQFAYPREPTRQANRARPPQARRRQRYEPGPGYWTLKTLALLVFLVSVIPAVLTVLVGKPIAGWVAACILSMCMLILQACVKRWG